MQVSNADVDELMDSVDTDRTGQLEFDEFRTLMARGMTRNGPSSNTTAQGAEMPFEEASIPSSAACCMTTPSRLLAAHHRQAQPRCPVRKCSRTGELHFNIIPHPGRAAPQALRLGSALR